MAWEKNDFFSYSTLMTNPRVYSGGAFSCMWSSWIEVDDLRKWVTMNPWSTGDKKTWDSRIYYLSFSTYLWIHYILASKQRMNTYQWIPQILNFNSITKQVVFVLVDYCWRIVFWCFHFHMPFNYFLLTIQWESWVL